MAERKKEKSVLRYNVSQFKWNTSVGGYYRSVRWTFVREKLFLPHSWPPRLFCALIGIEKSFSDFFSVYSSSFLLGPARLDQVKWRRIDFRILHGENGRFVKETVFKKMLIFVWKRSNSIPPYWTPWCLGCEIAFYSINGLQ